MSEQSSVVIKFVDGRDVPIKHKHADRMVVMSDSASPDGPSLYYTPAEWEAFVLGVKDGEFDDMVEEPAGPGAAGGGADTGDAPSS